MDLHQQQQQQQQQHDALTGADNLPVGPSLQLANESEVVRKAGRQAISAFLDSHNCFSVLRASGKVVVFDTRIPIQLAFYALVEHDMQAAPLWDPTQCQFVGLLKVTDFIDILRHFKRTNGDVGSLATRSIANMIQDPSIAEAVNLTFGFPAADSSTSLKQACKILLAHSSSSNNPNNNNNSDSNGGSKKESTNAADAIDGVNDESKATNPNDNSSSGSSSHKTRLDFLPIVMPEDMRVLACITYTNILEHLVTHFRETRRLFDDSIYDLKIGTYHERLVKVGPDETLARALELMHENELSALPVVDLATDRLIGVYSRSDITFLTRATDAEDAVANLDLTLNDVLDQQRTDVTTPDAMHSCSTAHTLQSIFEYFAQLRFNRLFVLDESERLVGVVSARDLVEYFMID
mmetsp:Transcript_18538/g.51762  ORF Transcript_18538/g.51762 Transcript_18538/m.51762 type:complete len:408 (-) Transcript_18538:390-1613(-)|eukprot:CAMPEP_0172357598 /NCGR_PEP_ID=MMETSP1060-20121228/1961_1 /TAXON_ID=37318 /ORGANISM="Pseudo-nitzschia pungens, Strain cf. cingulata" /LENGTH=407 /DNA_ID=CAMNT_0013078359 /DNA_START=476 /DNA_END=1699 /DNA_ORIENTATION=+